MAIRLNTHLEPATRTPPLTTQTVPPNVEPSLISPGLDPVNSRKHHGHPHHDDSSDISVPDATGDDTEDEDEDGGEDESVEVNMHIS